MQVTFKLNSKLIGERNLSCRPIIGDIFSWKEDGHTKFAKVREVQHILSEDICEQATLVAECVVVL